MRESGENGLVDAKDYESVLLETSASALRFAAVAFPFPFRVEPLGDHKRLLEAVSGLCDVGYSLVARLEHDRDAVMLVWRILEYAGKIRGGVFYSGVSARWFSESVRKLSSRLKGADDDFAGMFASYVWWLRRVGEALDGLSGLRERVDRSLVARDMP